MRGATIIVLSVLALLLTAGGATADEETTPSPEQSRRSSAEILAHMDRPETEQSWFSHHLSRIHLHDDTGFAYSRPLRLGGRDLEFSVGGPALDGLSLGLSFEIHF